MPAQPDNPDPAHAHIDSMLSRKFGKEVANYFSGSPLNRVAFLRADSKFLSQALKHDSTSFLLCNELQPLVQSNTKPGRGKLAYVKYNHVQSIIGGDPFSKDEKELVATYNSDNYIPQIIFLGIDEKNKNRLTYQAKNRYTGAPYFAVDVTPRGSVKEASEKLIADLKSKSLEFGKGRIMHLEAQDAAIYAEARQLLDWNARNPYCAACGSLTMSVNAGFKRTCPPTDGSTKRVSNAIPPNTEQGADPKARPPCVTRTGISNLCFPRTDPTVIMAVMNAKGDRILLGRQKRWPAYWFSTLAGFAEPAESIEEAVRREVYEEAGILVGRVVIHSTQPWPYPANLMIGAIGQAIPTGETIDLGHDPELDDARWFEFDEVRHALRVGTSGLGEDASPEYKQGDLRLPPNTAIANQLMTAVVNGFASGETKI
ncbi:NAD-capped RNA hydrolase NPY1 [Fulvia fulva]|uniref:NAD(+) diphosphatase n=1 Tax=Passalora fulva TaxID=5499 RepID=A0A9Q8PBQ9_PASFU|nr:NAD-capped RNA hydrolase NPY1 [Fulvia fulva]KAK4621212.1 NAD-capped RNA hydrolase NPY1 [Fulvia fulva]KAK4623125.1 NAD-capped RNA hydrolase NPY1 [Fulvia fulva]UJO19537.1 NAD-capped RNA hydrolase NPY1 [Fulvia fulva]WPV15964.1 NAD-capped RNA hydrolase NPY1 [Fulvia fulva]WPV31733.1 NAD-capped RNA hydrolase NPY1 [Fulvia fulva]